MPEDVGSTVVRQAEGRGRRPTMRDVAARAGVSLKTVSRVVNVEPGVSAALAARVQRAIADLDFRPDAGASSLRRSDRRTLSVGVVLEDVGNPFSGAVLRAVEDEALARRVFVLAGSVDEDPERERELVRALTARRVDGLVLVPASEDLSYLSPDVRGGTSVVCIDREASGLAVDSVVTTNRAGSAEAVRHLADVGHRRIAFLGDRATISTARQRHDGYVQALRTRRLPVDPSLVVHGLRDSVAADGAVTSLLDRADPPTALFTAQNLVTIGAVRALRRMGLERSVAVVGFDDFPTADLLAPGITVVAQDAAAMGRLAAELLFARIGGSAGPHRAHVVPTTFVRRGSGEIPPG